MSPTPQTPSKSARWVAFLSMLAFIVLTGYIAVEMIKFPTTKGPSGGPKKIELITTPGMKVSQIADWLITNQVVRHPVWFRYYLREKMSGFVVKQGHYNFGIEMTPQGIVEVLRAGQSLVLVPLQIIEGDNMLDVSQHLEKEGFCKQAEALAWMRNKDFVQSFQIPADTLEGYLQADTHKFAKDSNCKKVISFVVKSTLSSLKKIIDSHPLQWKTLLSMKITSHGIVTPHDLLILASLVEKETANPDERVLIAGVFLNRLNLASFPSHRLETDPTIKYGCLLGLPQSEACKSFEGRIRRIHLQDKDNPYNTYMHPGLPKGPIANPSLASIKAVLEATQIQTPYLYFVSKNNGTHQFSATFAEHNAAVDKYQRTKPQTKP